MTADTPELYSILGLPRDASPADIKRAYRAAARTYHPDVNKAEDATEQFQRIQLAYDVLSDPARRAQYDQDGTIDAGGADNAVAQLLLQLSTVFNEAMGAIMGKQQDPTQVDLIRAMIDILLDNERAILAANTQFARNRAVLSKLLGRFSRDDDQPNHMETLIKGQIADIDRNVITNKTALEHARVPRLYLEGCRYRRQEPMMRMSGFVGFAT